MNAKSPLGRSTRYRDRYSPEVLYAIDRRDSRRGLGLDGGTWPYRGEDLWTAYDLSWLQRSGKPEVAIAMLRVPAASPRLIESKSLKLYLDSFAMTRYDGREAVASAIGSDLSNACGMAVNVTLVPPEPSAVALSELPGICIDDVPAECDRWEVDPSLISASTGEPITETLHSNLLRSLCPVTGQPDIGSILIRYNGPKLDRAALLRYLCSYRSHSDFHENCIERIFLDLKNRCDMVELSVYARYNRRGGLDINPFRSDTETAAPPLRLPRQ